MKSDIPVVTIDHIYNDTTTILSDNVGGMTELVDFVVANGHKKIAFIHGADSSVTRQDWLPSIKNGRIWNRPFQMSTSMESPYRDTHGAYEMTLKLLALDEEERPTCIFYPDDYASYGGMRAISEKGLKVPDDVSVVGFDGIKLQDILGQGLLLTDRIRRVGRQAGKNLIDLIERPKTTLVQRVVVKGRLLEGDTLKKLN